MFFLLMGRLGVEIIAKQVRTEFKTASIVCREEGEEGEYDRLPFSSWLTLCTSSLVPRSRGLGTRLVQFY